MENNKGNKNKLNLISLIIAIIALIVSSGVALSLGNYFTPSLIISNGRQLEVSSEIYYVGDEIIFNIPIYASSGSSDHVAIFSGTLYHEGLEVLSIKKTIEPERPVLFLIPVNVTAKDFPRDEFKLEFVYDGVNDEPWYKGDVPYHFKGEITGSIVVKNRRE